MDEFVEPFVISGEGVLTPPDRERWVTEEMFLQHKRKPTFATKEVAEVFFGKSPVWLRNKMIDNPVRYRVDRSESGHRRFALHQIEAVAHLLLEDGLITPKHFAMVIRHVKASAVQYGYEIGDTGFLLNHWNAAQLRRKELITKMMDLLEAWDAGRAQRADGDKDAEAVRDAAAAIQYAEKHLTREGS